MIYPCPALRDLLTALPDGALVARSCKVAPRGLSPNRMLCSLTRAALAPAAGKRFLTLAEAFLGQSCTPLSPFVAEAGAFHFALDPKDATAGEVRKVYVEMDPAPGRDLAYVALKSASGAARLTRYHRRAPGHAMLVLQAMTLPAAVSQTFAALCQHLGPDADVEFLEVSEDASPRRSLDLNLSDVVPAPKMRQQILHMADLIHPGAAADCWPTSGLSHVAVGQSATGVAFLTLYGFPESVRLQTRPAPWS